MTNRRRFLRNAALAGTALAAPVLQATSPMRRKIDCHTHFYDPTRPEGVPWPGKDTPLYRRVLPDDWMEVAGPHGITDTVVVEASPWVEDNQFLLDLAAKDKRLLGIIGNLDPVSPEFAANVKRFAAKPLPDEWKSEITAAAARKNVFIKVSALVEGVKGEPGSAPTDPEYYRPVIDPIWNAFGPDRLIYGSNWPVSDRGAPYGTVVGVIEAYFDEKGADVSNKFFARNSRAAYRWQERV